MRNRVTKFGSTSHLEHLPGPLAVRGGDEGGVDVEEAVALEEVVRGASQGAAYPRHRADSVGPRPKVH